jgi:hypothetical protein
LSPSEENLTAEARRRGEGAEGYGKISRDSAQN